MYRAAAMMAIFLMGSTVPGFCETQHAVDMTKIMLDEQGKPAKDVMAKDPATPGMPDPDPRCDRCPMLTLGVAISHALFASFQQDKDTAEQKWARAVLAQRIRDDPQAALTADEISIIKRQLGQAYGGVLLMQAYPLLDPNAKPPAVR